MSAAVSRHGARARRRSTSHLGVGPLRADGYHRSRPSTRPIGLYDEVTVDAGRRLARQRRPATTDRVGGVPAGRDQPRRPRGAALLAAHHGVEPGVATRTSARASRSPAGWPAAPPTRPRPWSPATALWGLRTPPRRTCSSWPRELGSDVPFALLGGTAMGTGRGELLTPVAGRAATTGGSSRSPTAGCRPRRSTGEFDRLHGGVRPVAAPSRPRRPDGRACAPANAPALGASAAQRPAGRGVVCGRTWRARPSTRAVELRRAGRLVSGSGPTCAFLASSASHASDLPRGSPVPRTSPRFARLTDRYRAPGRRETAWPLLALRASLGTESHEWVKSTLAVWTRVVKVCKVLSAFTGNVVGSWGLRPRAFACAREGERCRL